MRVGKVRCISVFKFLFVIYMDDKMMPTCFGGRTVDK